MDLSSLTIDRLGLSVRAHNALRRRKIHTAEELLALTEEQLYETRNLGQKSVEEVLSVIDELKSGRFRLGSRSLDSETPMDTRGRERLMRQSAEGSRQKKQFCHTFRIME